jgi:hypothetical protein
VKTKIIKNIVLVFVLFTTVDTFSQVKVSYALIDKKMQDIPLRLTFSTDSIASFIKTNFKSENDKVRASFIWIASNISYDVKNMFTVNYNQTANDRITTTLKTRKGICSDYAAIFNEINAAIGINSIIISGYTKQNGTIGNLAHAWCAARIDNQWFVFDPTWAAGGISNGAFIKKLNEVYFKAEPNKIIASHMPFDYLWQFLKYPITNAEFYEGKTKEDKTRNYFDFEKKQATHNSLSEVDQLFESSERIEKNGLKNALIVTYYQTQRQNLTALRQNINVQKLNAVVNDMN